MKKIICLLITFIMLVQCAGIVSAGDWTDSLSPYIDMEVRKSGTTRFINGPLNITGDSAVVDYQTTLEMAPVLGKFVEWYDYAVSIIDNLAQLGSDRDLLMGRLGELVIEGQFVVKIEYPKALQPTQEFIDGGNMYGFNEEAKEIFYEKSRVLTPGAVNNVITITVGVKGAATDELKAKELYENKEEYLADLTLTAEDVQIPAVGRYTVRGTMEGYTQTEGIVSNAVGSLRVDYTGMQPEDRENPYEEDTISATVVLKKPAGGSGGTTASLSFNVDGDTTLIPTIENPGVVQVGDLPKPTKAGYRFDGWYYDSAHTMKIDDDVIVSYDMVIFGHFVSNMLESEDHFAYVIGYPDGTVRPTGYITREEVTTIFYRLLREDEAIKLVANQNIFPDVLIERWSSKAILSMASGGFVKGYEDGTFGPEKYITRAEFATMATRYAALKTNKELGFTDVDGHWAEDYINKAANAGWVNGYEDGTFGPEKHITRAEVMTIINRMLVRYVDEEGLHADTKLWIDMDGSEWYYYNVLEATNAHNHVRREDGKLEKWTEITPNKIWIELDEMENADK